MTQLDLEAIEARCEALDERLSRKAWTLEGPNHYGLFSVYDGNGNVVSRGIKEQQDFIVHARSDVPALAAEVERLQTESDTWEKHHLVQTVAERNELRAALAEREAELAILRAAIEQLRRELHDERVRRSEWEKMYNRAIAGTEAKRLRDCLAAVLDEASSDLNRDIIITECQSALKERHSERKGETWTKWAGSVRRWPY